MLNSIKKPSFKRRRKRVGRGDSSGLGRTCGRGEKGQKSRSGSTIRPHFEGGQIPLFRRLPHIKGFKSRNHKYWTIISLSDIANNFSSDEEVTEKTLKEKGLIQNSPEVGIKVLAGDKIDKPLTIKVNAYSKSAQEQITAAGGKFEVV